MGFGDNVFSGGGTLSGADDPLKTDKTRPIRGTVSAPSSPFDRFGSLMSGSPLEGMMPGGNGGHPATPLSAPPATPMGSFPITPGQPFGPPGGPVQVNPGNDAAKPGNTSGKNLQTVLANMFNYNSGVQGGLLNENENALNLGNIPNTPLYKSNLTAANEATGSAYDQAMANARKSAMGAGFGYANPLEQGAETQVRAGAASQLSRNPSLAMKETVSPILQAAGIRSNEMGQFDPAKLMAIWEDMVSKKGAATAGLMGSLFQAAGQVGAAAATPSGDGG